ncbi:MAG: twin-arginine translocase subunit TatC [Pirellulales bacterium]|nr:twin-arginine translocase subunit TatC [Pirellulales bacterium]
MSKHRYSDDLFKDSTMTFGEHLEELRVCLFRAVLGLAIGFVIGLALGRPVVAMFQMPLDRALQRHVAELTRERRAAQVAEMPANQRPQGETDPVNELIDEGFTYDDWLIDPRPLLDEIEKTYPGAINRAALPPVDLAKTKENLMPLRLFRRITDDRRTELTTLNAQEGFMIYIKASLVTGVVLASPWILLQLWIFVAAGLYPHERSYVYVFLPFSLLLFLMGASLAFFFVFDPVLDFLFAFNRWLGLGTDMRISEWLSFVLLMPLGFGVSFQLPLVMLFLERIGVFTAEMYASQWRISVLVICVLAMVLTPSGDPYSMLLMAVPLVGLYFGGIALCRYMPKKTSDVTV